MRDKTTVQAHYARNLSALENFYRALECDNAFYIQWVVDFESLPADLNWQTAIDVSLKSNPGISVKLSSDWLFKKWLASDSPVPFIETRFDGGLEDALFALPTSLSENGSVSEVRKIIYAGGVALVFRALHSVVDANGLWWWLSDCIRSVSGLPPVGHQSAINDKELACRVNSNFVTPLLDKGAYIALTSGDVAHARPFYFFTIPGTAKGLSKKLCHIFKRYAKIKNIDKLRVFIPSDLRKYDDSILSTGNLTGILDIEFSKDTADEDISRSIKEGLVSRSDAQYVRRINFWKFYSIPTWKKLLKPGVTTNKYPTTGLISNLGDLDPAQVTVHGICPRNVICIAPFSNFHPVFILFGAFKNQLTLTFAIPKHLQGNASELVNFIKEELMKDGSPGV
jgi:hypothetical protein